VTVEDQSRILISSPYRNLLAGADRGKIHR
jgi:hypothetical protein